jgi:hypothetical protein
VSFEPGYVLVGNIVDDRLLRCGARVVIEMVPGNPDRVRVAGLSIGGRRITRWLRVDQLRDVRVAWEHDPEWPAYTTKEAAEQEWRRFPAAQCKAPA